MRQRDIPTRQRISAPSRFKSSNSKFVKKEDPLPVYSLRNIGQGLRLHILACGPSMKMTYRPDMPGDVMCINKPVLEYHPRWWVFFDETQKRRNIDVWNLFRGTILTGYGVKPPRKHNQIMIPAVDIEAFCTDGFVWIGKDSTYAACQLAAFMNYDMIFVHGLDKTQVNGQTHFYGKNEDAPDEYRLPRFDQECYAWDWAATHVSPEVKRKFRFMSPYNTREWVWKWTKDI